VICFDFFRKLHCISKSHQDQALAFDTNFLQKFN